MSAEQQSSLRLLAPAALVVFAIVFLIVVVASLGGDGESSTSERPALSSTQSRSDRAEAARERRATARARRNRRFYVVRAGDTFVVIAQRTGVSIEDLRLLNPDLDPQALVTGQRVRLRAAEGTTGATGATGSQNGTSSE